MSRERDRKVARWADQLRSYSPGNEHYIQDHYHIDTDEHWFFPAYSRRWAAAGPLLEVMGEYVQVQDGNILANGEYLPLSPENVSRAAEALVDAGVEV